VLTHGAGDESDHWAGLIGPLARDHSVVRWDLPGHGNSPELPADRYNRETCLDALDDMIEAAGRPAVLIGHSYGGYLSMATAILHPERVRALVLVATGPGFRSEKGRARWNKGVAAYAERLGSPAAGLAHQADGMVSERLAEINVPILQVCGDRDTRFHAALEHIESTVGDVTTVVIESSGHAVASSHADQVAMAIRAFLDRVPAP
jgi:pimeloyl-ACP methyl ester carboxylesterase